MKATVFSLLILGTCLDASVLFAQQKQKSNSANTKKEETVIIKRKDADSPQTIIEIKSGDVYVNGEKVASADDKTGYKKIIVDGDADMPDSRFSMPWNSGKTNKAMLGVISSPDKTVEGAAIQQVTPGSAAKKAGLKEGDVITKIDGTAIKNSQELVDAIGKYEVGDKVSITYNRSGKPQQTEATLSGAFPQNFSHMFRFRDMDDMDIPNAIMPPFTFDIGSGAAPSPKLGVSVEDRADEDGVTVLDIKPNSAAERAGLHKNDIILKLGDEKVSSVDDLQSALRHADNGKQNLQYQRNGKTETTSVLIEKPSRKKDL